MAGRIAARDSIDGQVGNYEWHATWVLFSTGRWRDDWLGRRPDWLLAQQDAQGWWANRHAYEGKMIRDIDRPGQPSKWVTLRACRVLKSVVEA
jgi:hypothetical protein